MFLYIRADDYVLTIRCIKRELRYNETTIELQGLNIDRPADVAEDVVLHAFRTGYRHVGEQAILEEKLFVRLIGRKIPLEYTVMKAHAPMP